MQEDYAGTLTAGTGRSYATCAECGQVFARHSARTEPTSLDDGAYSEYTELCPDCEQLDSQGELPVATDSDDTRR
jgi:hypothetical protein